eukprot:TRINITY_DN1611_c0_g2_i1.p1 TRINITY_DN1611_c0_g2~~TRINITY_DN1611_c0_g2_i1.p1  ORF type:complete len:580 (+),score=78.33 TRINITY_DN1611_c0_g2_i1:169-1908(+)
MQGLVEVVPSRRIRFSTAPSSSATRALIINVLSVKELDLHLRIAGTTSPFHISFQKAAQVEQLDGKRYKLHAAPGVSLNLQLALDRKVLPSDARPIVGFFVLLVELCEPLIQDIIVAPDDVSEEAIRQLADARRPEVAAEMLAEVQAMASLGLCSLLPHEKSPQTPEAVEAEPSPMVDVVPSTTPSPSADPPRRTSSPPADSLPKLEDYLAFGNVDRGRTDHSPVATSISSARPRVPARTKPNCRVSDNGSDTSPEPGSSSGESDVAAAAAARHRMANRKQGVNGRRSQKSSVPYYDDDDDDRPPTPTPEEFMAEISATANNQCNAVLATSNALSSNSSAFTGRPPPAPMQLPRGSQTSLDSSQAPLRGRSGGDRAGNNSSGPLLRSAGASMLGLTASNSGNAERRCTASSEPPPADRQFFLDGIGWCDAYGRVISGTHGGTATRQCLSQGQRTLGVGSGSGVGPVEVTARSWPATASTAVSGGTGAKGPQLASGNLGTAGASAGGILRTRSKPPPLGGGTGTLGGSGVRSSLACCNSTQGTSAARHRSTGRLAACGGGVGRSVSARERARNWDALEGI